MEKEMQNQIHTGSGAGAEAQAGGQAPSFDGLLAQSPTLSPLRGWLKCLRKPALSMEYSIRKRHIPDLDAECSTAGGSTAGGRTASGIAASGGEKSRAQESGDQGSTDQGSTDQSSTDQGSTDRGSAAQAPKGKRASSEGGQNSDVMALTGGFTIRYLDLALGAMGLLLAGCLWRGCCCLKRIMK